MPGSKKRTRAGAGDWKICEMSIIPLGQWHSMPRARRAVRRACGRSYVICHDDGSRRAHSAASRTAPVFSIASLVAAGLDRMGNLEFVDLRSESWSTDGSTATSTESRPIECRRRRKRLIYLRELVSAPTTTSSIWRRIRMGIARIIRAGCLINQRLPSL
jgi:hypothetical protein